MIKESQVFQRIGELKRKWFSDDYFDLIVWYTASNVIAGFQLCYDKRNKERSLTWMEGQGFRHDAIDSGESEPTKNLSPILIPDGLFPADVATKFQGRSLLIDQTLKQFVLDKINEYLESICTLKK